MSKVDITLEVDKDFYDSVVQEVKEKFDESEEEVEYGLKFLLARKFSKDLRELKHNEASEKLLEDLKLGILHSKQEK